MIQLYIYLFFAFPLTQPMWSTVEGLSPDVWLWMGDVVYVDMQEDGKLDAQSHGSIEKVVHFCC